MGDLHRYRLDLPDILAHWEEEAQAVRADIMLLVQLMEGRVAVVVNRQRQTMLTLRPYWWPALVDLATTSIPIRWCRTVDADLDETLCLLAEMERARLE